MRSLLTLAIAAVICSGCSNSNAIVENGSTEYTIIISKDADSLTQRAANVLNDYISEATGVMLPVGNSPAGKSIELSVETDGSAVGYAVTESGLMIRGNDSRALLDATYTFLENELGVRFYAPDADEVPKRDVWQLSNDLNWTYTPAVHTRTVHSRLFYENHEFADKLHVTHEAFPGYVPGARVHTFHRFVPAEKYYDDHPEYYALRGGKRLPTQLCLTNENVYTIVRDEVARLLDEHPKSGVISVSQDDNTLYCTCEDCEALHQENESPAGSMIHFVNRIAREFPEKQISTLAYQYTRKAPTKVVPEDNVLITLCSIECDRSAPIDEKCQDFSEDLKQWSKLTDNVRIWDYTTQFTNFLAPFPNIHTLKPNINLFVDNNAKWIFEQHSSNPSSLFELRSYLTAKLLWNPQFDADSIINGFANGYYEEGGKYIVEYIDLLEQQLKKNDSFFLFLYGDPAQGFDSFLSEDNLEKYNQLFDAAFEAVGDSEVLKRRINMARIEVDYASLEFAKTRLSDLSKDQLQEVRQRLTRFTSTTAMNNITMMNEMRFMVDEYLDMYERTLERAVLTNYAKGKTVTLQTKPTKYANEDPAVLTDGAFGGGSFYANWLGFLEDVEAVIDLEEEKPITEINTAFLKVVNHVVFYPYWVEFYGSLDGTNYQKLGRVENKEPLEQGVKINDVQYFTLSDLPGQNFRYIKVKAKNFDGAPVWHHAAGNPVWIFLDEIEVR